MLGRTKLASVVIAAALVSGGTAIAATMGKNTSPTIGAKPNIAVVANTPLSGYKHGDMYTALFLLSSGRVANDCMQNAVGQRPFIESEGFSATVDMGSLSPDHQTSDDLSLFFSRIDLDSQMHNYSVRNPHFIAQADRCLEHGTEVVSQATVGSEKDGLADWQVNWIADRLSDAQLEAVNSAEVIAAQAESERCLEESVVSDSDSRAQALAVCDSRSNLESTFKGELDRAERRVIENHAETLDEVASKERRHMDTMTEILHNGSR